MRYLVRYLANGLNFEGGSGSDFILFLNDLPGYDERTRKSPVLVEDTCPKSTNKFEEMYVFDLSFCKLFMHTKLSTKYRRQPWVLLPPFSLNIIHIFDK